MTCLGLHPGRLGREHQFSVMAASARLVLVARLHPGQHRLRDDLPASTTSDLDGKSIFPAALLVLPRFRDSLRKRTLAGRPRRRRPLLGRRAERLDFEQLLELRQHDLGDPGSAWRPDRSAADQLPRPRNFLGSAPVNFDPLPGSSGASDALATCAGGGTVNALDPNFKMPSTWRFNLGLDADWAVTSSRSNTSTCAVSTGCSGAICVRPIRPTRRRSIRWTRRLRTPISAASATTSTGRPSGTGSGFRDIVPTNVDEGEAQYIVLAARRTGISSKATAASTSSLAATLGRT